MLTLSIKKTKTSVFITDRTTYICDCGNIVEFTGNIQPVLCDKCHIVLPDIQYMRGSTKLRVLCHCNEEEYEKEKFNYIEEAFY